MSTAPLSIPLRCAQPRHAAGQLRGWARAWLVWLCLAQCALPLLGRVHDLVHPAGAMALAISSATPADGAADALATLAPNDGFGHHSAAECQWFKHLALGYALHGGDAGVQITVFAPLQNVVLAGLLLRQSPALYFARGPPGSPASIP